ncbi:MAG: hypothetical protein AAGA87_04190 [Pseudomonadota bacterium]
MFGRYPVTDTVEAWIEENFAWAIEHGLLTAETPLVLPTEDFFKAPKGAPEAVAAALLDDMKRLLKRETAKIDIIPIDQPSAEYRYDYNLVSVGGTWQKSGDNTAVIRYDAEMIHQPMALMSVLAHELMHHILDDVDEDPPGGEEAGELATDLHVITMGLGVIQLSGAEQAGWQGYMTQPSRAHALALFLLVRDLDPKEALRHLTPRAAKYLRRSLRRLRKTPEVPKQLAASLRDRIDRTRPGK